MKAFYSLILISCLFYALELKAQDLNLSKAQELYADGDYLGALENLNLAKTKISREEKEAVLILLSNIYIEMKDRQHENKDSIAYLILKNNPHFNPKRNLYSESLIESIKKYQVFPRLKIGFSTGFNQTNLKTKNYANIIGEAKPEEIILQETGYKHSLVFEYGLNQTFSFLTEFSYVKSSYNNLQIFEQPTFYARNSFREVFYSNDIELNLRYYPFTFGKFQPYLSFGWNLSKLRQSEIFMSSTAAISGNNYSEEYWPQGNNSNIVYFSSSIPTTIKSNKNYSIFRNNIGNGFIGTVGCYINQKNYQIGLEIKVLKENSIFNSSGNKYREEFIYSNFLVENPRSIIRTCLSLSYTYKLLYKVREKK